MRSVGTLIILAAGVATAAAQQDGNWRMPGPIQQPGAIQQPGSIQQPGPIRNAGDIQQLSGPWTQPGEIQKAGEIQQPKGPWIVPGEIQQPKGPWLKPGEIQVPKGIQAVSVTATNACENRLSVLADALFDFDKANLRADAEATLKAALPEIAKATGHAARVEGHTDGKGSDAYNMKLAEARGRTVRDWLGANGAIPPATPIKAFGKGVPIAPNTNPDGSDNPEGRQKNRRVEIVFETCKS
jgi:outer membrane protein OmpA-like peptidoglycan-associated protein